MGPKDDSMLDGSARFVTTRWSVVLGAGAPPGESREDALEILCGTYWPAVYAYLRRRGLRRDEARDLTQAFFARLLEKEWLARADRERGSFRAFLVTMLRRFVAGEHERENAQRRGGDARKLPFAVVPGAAGVPEPVSEDTPEHAFDRAWVRSLVGRVLEDLRGEYDRAGQGQRFSCLESHLVPGDSPPPFRDMAQSLGIAEASCRVAVFRARRRYRDLVRAEIASTLDDPAEVEAELDALLACLGEPGRSALG